MLNIFKFANVNKMWIFKVKTVYLKCYNNFKAILCPRKDCGSEERWLQEGKAMTDVTKRKKSVINTIDFYPLAF